MDELDALTALSAASAKAVLSHEEAARRHGIELVDDTGIRRLTVPRNRSRAAVDGWKIARHDLTDDEVTLMDGLQVTAAARTVFDLCGVLALDRAVAAAESALRKQLVTLKVLVEVLGAARGRGASRPRRVAGLLDPLSGSVLESLLRVLLAEAGLARPVSQYAVHNPFGRVIATVDLCWVAERLVVEVDGFAFHSDRDAYRSDRIRMNELETLGWRVLRFTWEDVMSRPAYVVSMVRSILEPSALAA